MLFITVIKQNCPRYRVPDTPSDQPGNSMQGQRRASRLAEWYVDSCIITLAALLFFIDFTHILDPNVACFHWTIDSVNCSVYEEEGGVYRLKFTG
jgi:hypothetical protein